MKLLRDSTGFTLFETMIAVAIMLVAFSAILLIESSSIATSIKSKRMNIVAMLAKNAMVDAEIEFQERTFNEVTKSASGTFDEPYRDFTWKREIKEIEFPNINFSAAMAAVEGEGADDPGSKTRAVEILTKVLTNYLSKALREVTVTITWELAGGSQSFSLTTYWADLNHEFSLTP